MCEASTGRGKTVTISKVQFKNSDIRRFAVDQACRFTEVIFENAPRVRSAEDTEGLHDMRVASRRLRETFRLFGMFYPPSKLKKILGQVKKLTRILGSSREMDVNVALLQDFQGEPDAVVQTTHEHLLETLERRKEKVRKRMHHALDEINLKKLRAEWVNFAQAALLEPEPQSVLSGIQREFESEAYLKQTFAILGQKATPLLAFQATALPSETDDTLHRLRIAVKKFRYVLEIYNPLHNQRFDAAIQAAKDLQDLLGKIHDYAVLVGQIQTGKAYLQQRNRLRLVAGCDKVIQFFEERRESLCPLLEPSYSAVTRELTPLLAPKPPLRFSLVRKRKSAKSKGATTTPLSFNEGADKTAK